jgi:hypothetical protein
LFRLGLPQGCGSLLHRVGGRIEVRVGKDGNHPSGAPDRDLHIIDEIRSGWPIPYVKLNGVPGADKLLANPQGPCSVCARVADKEVSVTLAHRQAPVAAHVLGVPFWPLRTKVRKEAGMT